MEATSKQLTICFVVTLTMVQAHTKLACSVYRPADNENNSRFIRLSVDTLWTFPERANSHKCGDLSVHDVFLVFWKKYELSDYAEVNSNRLYQHCGLQDFQMKGGQIVSGNDAFYRVHRYCELVQ